MKQLRSWQLAAAIILGGVALAASRSWESKDPSQWTSEEIDQIINKSAWAKRTDVSVDRSGMQQRGGGRAGGGGMGIPGIGFPGGGMGGGGMGGGGMGRGRGGGGRGGPQMEQESVVVRWDTALPVKLALRRGTPKDVNASEGETKPVEDTYVISVIGLRAPRHRQNSDDSDSSQSDENSQKRIKDELMTTTKLTPKGRDPLSPSGVQLDSMGGTSEVRFIFPKKDPISLDDKEVEFETRLGPGKVSAKFHPKDMRYKGKLEL